MRSVTEILHQPRTRNQLANSLNRSYGYELKLEAGGGWGDTRSVPWVKEGNTWLSVGFLVRTVGAVGVICCGPSVGNEATYVRADKWIPHWKAVPQEQAEEKLLLKYLKAFGPSTMTDFALWIRLYMQDVKEIWSRIASKITTVDVEGWRAAILQSDTDELEQADMKKSAIRLPPNFDAFLLGHKSHRNIVGEENQKKIYRAQGWISPVLLINGRAADVWSYTPRKTDLDIRVIPFSKLPRGSAR